jgi:hypothetical protein
VDFIVLNLFLSSNFMQRVFFADVPWRINERSDFRREKPVAPDQTRERNGSQRRGALREKLASVEQQAACGGEVFW